MRNLILDTEFSSLSCYISDIGFNSAYCCMDDRSMKYIANWRIVHPFKYDLQRFIMILPSLYIARAGKMGRGVFTSRNLKMATVIEIAPVIVMDNADRQWIDKTLLHDYIFEWGGKRKQCCMALGWVALYNHSYKSNCEYEMDYKNQLIQIITVRNVKKGEELFINYNGEWNNAEKVWFDTHG